MMEIILFLQKMIAEILETLTPEDRNRIFAAFNEEVEAIICLDNRKFVAVNLFNNEDYKIEEEAGSFTYGEAYGRV